MRDLSKLIEFSTEEGKYSIFKSSYKIRRNFHRLGMDLVMIPRIHKIYSRNLWHACGQTRFYTDIINILELPISQSNIARCI